MILLCFASLRRCGRQNLKDHGTRARRRVTLDPRSARAVSIAERDGTRLDPNHPTDQAGPADQADPRGRRTKTMKLALIGYGRMGREIERAAREAGHRIVAICDPNAPEALIRYATPESLADADAALDFSRADAVLSHIEAACAARVPIVIGATGWEADLARARKMVEDAAGAMIHASNFAMGVQVLFRLVEQAARAVDGLPDVDVSIHEIHHRAKADSPSGTAKSLARILLDAMNGKNAIVTDPAGLPPSPNQIHVTAQRVGAEPGTHTVRFDLGGEVLTIEHVSRGRAIFAAGALKAAEWIAGKQGVHEFREVLFGSTEEGGI
jgi:4-hydroxy-tetrahydrodipicolinate reductase